MSKLLPVARITVAVLDDLGNAAPIGHSEGKDARSVTPEAVKAFWEKVRRPAR
jgi:hypothetical protein